MTARNISTDKDQCPKTNNLEERKTLENLDTPEDSGETKPTEIKEIITNLQTASRSKLLEVLIYLNKAEEKRALALNAEGCSIPRPNLAQLRARVSTADDAELDGLFVEFISDLSEEELIKVRGVMTSFLAAQPVPDSPEENTESQEGYLIKSSVPDYELQAILYSICESAWHADDLLDAIKSDAHGGSASEKIINESLVTASKSALSRIMDLVEMFSQKSGVSSQLCALAADVPYLPGPKVIVSARYAEELSSGSES